MATLSRNINVISRCASAYRAERLAGSEISSAHYFYIIAICKNPGISQDKLSKKLYLNKSRVARALQSLENDGFITRRQSETDRRITLVYPTKKAQDIMPLIGEIVRDWNEFLFLVLDEEEQELFCGLLDKVAKQAASYVDAKAEEQE